MCGIAGFYSPSNAFSKEDLMRMNASLSHRGPDANGIYFENGIGLGHRRLSILDLSSFANQPFVSSCGRYVIVYNGEVYNFRELVKELNIELKTTGDTEVLIEGFAKFGPEFVNKLNGMFAFVVLDQQQKELFVFRDRMGIKPLYYYWNNQNFAFASETKALLTLNIDRSIDKTSLKDYFFLEYIPKEKSIFKNIQKLENGYYLKISKAGLIKCKYYDLLEKYNPQSYTNEEHIIEKFYQELSKSVSYQSISDVSLGAFLSGGTDSSLICSVFQSQNSNPVNSFTVGFNVKSFDESKYAEKVAACLHTNHRLKVINEEDAKGLINNLVEFYDEPFAAPSAIPSLIVCKNAREHVKVAMSGDGGDELFMGYGYYHWYNRVKRINQIGGVSARKLISYLLSCLSSNTYQRASRLFDFKDYHNMWLHIWSQEQYMFSEKEVSLLLNEPYVHQTMLAEWNKIDKHVGEHSFEKISLFDLKNYLPNNLLYKMDIASMAHGLEVRVPYLDHNLVEFSMNLPLDLKVRKGEQKFLMKKVLERFLPKDLIYRKKWGFPAPLGDWLKGDLKYLIEVHLNKEILVRQDLFDPFFVESLVKEFREGKDYHYKRIWSLIFFQMWYKKYIDQNL